MWCIPRSQLRLFIISMLLFLVWGDIFFNALFMCVFFALSQLRLLKMSFFLFDWLFILGLLLCFFKIVLFFFGWMSDLMPSCDFRFRSHAVFWLIPNSFEISTVDIPFFLTEILKRIPKALLSGILILWNSVWAVDDSSYLHNEHRLWKFVLPLIALGLPHCLQL